MSDFTRHRRWHLSETVCSAEALQRPNDVTWMQKKKRKCLLMQRSLIESSCRTKWEAVFNTGNLWHDSTKTSLSEYSPPQKVFFFLLLSSNFSSRFTAGFSSADCRRKSLHVSSSRRLQIGPARLWWMFRLTACHCRTEWKFSFWSERIWLYNLDYFGLTLGEYSLFLKNFTCIPFSPHQPKPN